MCKKRVCLLGITKHVQFLDRSVSEDLLNLSNKAKMAQSIVDRSKIFGQKEKLNPSAITQDLEEKENDFARLLVDHELATTTVLKDVVNIFGQLPSTFSGDRPYELDSKVYFQRLTLNRGKSFN